MENKAYTKPQNNNLRTIAQCFLLNGWRMFCFYEPWMASTIDTKDFESPAIHFTLPTTQTYTCSHWLCFRFFIIVCLRLHLAFVESSLCYRVRSINFKVKTTWYFWMQTSKYKMNCERYFGSVFIFECLQHSQL